MQWYLLDYMPATKTHGHLSHTYTDSVLSWRVERRREIRNSLISTSSSQLPIPFRESLYSNDTRYCE